MVTLETTKDIFFALEDCTLCKFIELVTKFLPLPPKILRMKKPPKEILNLSPTKTFPVLKSGDDFITGALPIIKYLIKSSKDISDGVLLDNRKILLGNNLKEEAAIETWTNYIFASISPITCEIKAQLYGKKKYDKIIFDEAINDLIDVLKPVNERLKLNTVYIDVFEIIDDKLYILGNLPTMLDNRVEIYLNNEKLELNELKFPQRDKYCLSYKYNTNYSFEVEIPLDRHKKYVIKFKNQNNIDLFIDFSRPCNFSKVVGYSKTKHYISYLEDNKIIIKQKRNWDWIKFQSFTHPSPSKRMGNTYIKSLGIFILSDGKL